MVDKVNVSTPNAGLIFDLLDRNHDGKLDDKELAKDAIACIDGRTAARKNGVVTKDEMVAFMAPYRAAVHGDLVKEYDPKTCAIDDIDWPIGTDKLTSLGAAAGGLGVTALQANTTLSARALMTDPSVAADISRKRTTGTVEAVASTVVLGVVLLASNPAGWVALLLMGLWAAFNWFVTKPSFDQANDLESQSKRELDANKTELDAETKQVQFLLEQLTKAPPPQSTAGALSQPAAKSLR